MIDCDNRGFAHMNGEMDQSTGVKVLKSLWERTPEGKWGITDLHGIDLHPNSGCEPDFFTIANRMEMMSKNPRGRTMEELVQTMGSTNLILKQSIVPVVALVAGSPAFRVIGTAFVVSASGLVMTAGHVLMDPEDSGYGNVTNDNGALRFDRNLQMGVLLPLHPAVHGQGAIQFAPFELCAYWGGWKVSPLFHERDRMELDTDVAVCRLPPHPSGAYQPLNLSLRPMEVSEKVFAIGYAEMKNIPVRYEGGRVVLSHFKQDLYVSVGTTTTVHYDNRETRSATTPGPCFEFEAKIPGKMSGSPILGGDGAVIRGVVSKSFSGERSASGALLGPAMHLPVFGHRSIKDMMLDGSEGIPLIQGAGL
ncbi:hypothetical protein RHOFW104T7_02520 [Rhodanobacter thiooxydans]|uniref:Serine protease n=2 Tax=Rhodanobacter thiooxydans TaxID=416169 RepID=A0A154QD45_9GAMM|nr:hypothetical protein RHOFW104T7_02520 [Rhodanobacter thiooxydans]